MNISDYISEHIVYLDGGMGTLLQAYGLQAGEYPERWNVSHPDIITSVHKAYFDAGSNVVCANTFGANSLKFSDEELEELIRAAVENADKARRESTGTQEKYIAMDMGSTGKLLKPYGSLDFEDAVAVFAKSVRIAAACGVDLIFIETMNDCYETKAALLAAKENCSLPVFVSNAYGEDGKLMTGASPAAMVAMLEGMGADAIGINCSLGPAQLNDVAKEYLQYASVPVILKPNAGLPCVRDGITCFDVSTDEFAERMTDYVRAGVRLIGGCCGTTPEYIKLLRTKTDEIKPVPLSDKNLTIISSYCRTVEFNSAPVLIGERINPTGKKRLKEVLRAGDTDYILNLGLSQQESGVHVLDVNVGLADIDEPEMLKNVCAGLQAIIGLPLQIDTSDSVAMEAALRRYNGKAMVNSVNGKKESMESVFPLVKKYGGLVVCLTLDENGIPDTAQGRFEIARNIIKTAEKYGIQKKDLMFDTLAMAVSADSKAAMTTLSALNMIKTQLNCHTILGVSNVSFGLPERDVITATFFALAMENGLSAAIMNPNSAEMMKTYTSFCVLHGMDSNCNNYIGNINRYVSPNCSPAAKCEAPQSADDGSDGNLTALQRAIVKGLKEQAASITAELIKTNKPLELVNNEIIPALNIVGTGFENKTVYLPQLLMSAESAQYAFEKVKDKLTQNGQLSDSKGTFVIATVRGDIHDIGKNIVKLILENYGFDVCDLGKDVSPEVIVEEVKRLHAPFVGLSALMTTTVPSMEATIKLLREQAPWAKIVVGGAVLTDEYAKTIGADYFGKDAMATVRYAVNTVSEKQ